MYHPFDFRDWCLIVARGVLCRVGHAGEVKFDPSQDNRSS